MVMRDDGVCIASLTDAHVPARGFVNIDVVGAPTRTANARLIAAAPDLLELLKEFVSGFGDYESEQMSRARAAIARAEGME